MHSFGLRLFVISASLAAAAWQCALAQGLQKFGPPKGKPALRAFGNPVGEEALRRQFPKLAAAVNNFDRQEAAREIQRTDGNGDGIVTPAEWNASGYQPPDRFLNNDLNRDGILTLFEHSLRWAQYRVGREQAAKSADATKSPSQPSLVNRSPSATISAITDPREKAHRIQIDELASQTFALYDRNRNGLIDKPEFHSPSSEFGDLTSADTDNDGTIGPAEITAYFATLFAVQSGSRHPDNLPPWFRAADTDADGQVHLSEYRRTGPKEVFVAFDRYDRNADGFVTAQEVALPLTDDTSRYASGRSTVIEAERDTNLELLVTDDVTIRDIDVQLALLKNGDDDVEIWLIGPDNTRASLYFDAKSKPWAGGRLFDNTLIDDETPLPSQRLTRPPLHRVFRSQGSATPGEQGLKAFYGKNARGAWRLVIRNKSQAPGLLEGWALLVKPTKRAPTPSPAPPKR